jgi:coenzyme F420 hydrogenase subunit beta
MAKKGEMPLEEMAHFSKLKEEVIDKGLCTRCGACTFICPSGGIEVGERFFPYLKGKCNECGLCFKVCPGREVNLPSLIKQFFGDEKYRADNLMGPSRGNYVCNALDKEIRMNGASGGVVTTLLNYLLEKKEIEGVIAIGMDPRYPWKVLPKIATNREELLNCAKSKYSIVSNLHLLKEFENNGKNLAIVVLPCQAQGLQKIFELKPEFRKKVKIIIGLYCHFSMEEEGTLRLLKLSRIPLSKIQKLEYRGGEWPGRIRIILRDGRIVNLYNMNSIKSAMTWLLRLYAPPRCFLCIDGSCELADLSVGDFWAIDYRDEYRNLEKCSHVTVRTLRGENLLHSACQDKALHSLPLPPERASKTTRNYIRKKKKDAFIRIERRKKKGKPVPEYHLSQSKHNFWDIFHEHFFGFTLLLSRNRFGYWFFPWLISSRWGPIVEKVNTYLRKMRTIYR